MKKGTELGSNKHTGRIDMVNNDDEQRRKDKIDAEKYRTRKEVRDQLVFFAAIIGGTLTVLYTLIQIVGDMMQ